MKIILNTSKAKRSENAGLYRQINEIFDIGMNLYAKL